MDVAGAEFVPVTVPASLSWGRDAIVAKASRRAARASLPTVKDLPNGATRAPTERALHRAPPADAIVVCGLIRVGRWLPARTMLADRATRTRNPCGPVAIYSKRTCDVMSLTLVG